MENKWWTGSDEVGCTQLWQGDCEYLPETLLSLTPHQAGSTDKCAYEVCFSTAEDETHQYFVHTFPSAIGETYTVTRMRIKE